MKKPILIVSLILNLIFVACSSDDDGESKVNILNTPPPAVALEITEENANENVEFSWNASTDVDGDEVVYDFYVNNEVLASNLTALEYVWEIDGTENHSYPATFKVVAKDGEGSSGDSNLVGVQDPFIGKWQLVKEIKNGIEEVLTDCDKLSTLEFLSDGTYEGNEMHQEVVDGACLEDIYDGEWSNKGNNVYGFLSEEETEDELITMEFGDDTVIFTKKYTVSGSEVINEIFFKKI